MLEPLVRLCWVKKKYVKHIRRKKRLLFSKTLLELKKKEEEIINYHLLQVLNIQLILNKQLRMNG